VPPNLGIHHISEIFTYVKSVMILLSAGERASAGLALDAPARVAVGAGGAVFGNVLDAVAQPGSTLPPHESR
jgi:hypothetical protein